MAITIIGEETAPSPNPRSGMTDYLDQQYAEQGECLSCYREVCPKLRQRTRELEQQMSEAETNPDPAAGYDAYTTAQRDLQATAATGRQMRPPCEVNSEYENRPPSDTLTDANAGRDELQTIADEVNPNNGNVNCGKIIDAADARLSGADPAAVAPIDRNGSWSAIENRYGTSFESSSYEDVFDRVREGGPGTRGLIGIHYPSGNSSHVAMVANQGGAVALIEGQGGGSLVTSAAAAAAAYDPNSTITYAPIN